MRQPNVSLSKIKSKNLAFKAIVPKLGIIWSIGDSGGEGGWQGLRRLRLSQQDLCPQELQRRAGRSVLHQEETKQMMQFF